MNETDRSQLYTAWVYLASAIAVGLPAAFVVAAALSAGLEAGGLDPIAISTAGTVVFWGVALLIGMVVANEVAAVLLGGYEVLTRGSPSVAIGRGLFLTLFSLALVGALTWVALSAVFTVSGPMPYVVAVLVAFGWLAVFYRVSSAFLDGLRVNGSEA